MPAWLSDGLTVLVFGIGTVFLTLLLLYQAIALFGRVVNRGSGNGPGPQASRGTTTGQPDGRRELLRAAAVAAALRAFVEAEAARGPGRAEGGRQEDVPARAGAPLPAHGPGEAPASLWAGAGRLALMNERQQIAARRGRSPR